MAPLTTYTDFRRELSWYDNAFPDTTFAEVSLALTGQEPIQKIIEQGDAALAGELDIDLEPYVATGLARSLRLLRALKDRQVTTFTMRHYDTSTGKTPEEINQDGAESENAMGLMAHNAAITATAEMAIYTLSEKMHALVWNPESVGTGPFHVRMGAYNGRFEVAFTADVDSYLQRNFYSDGWRRAEHFTDSEPWVYADPRNPA